MIALLPLAAVATALASTPWLRVFPAGTIAFALFGAAVLSVVIAAATAPLTRRSLPAALGLDVVLGVVFLLLAVLRAPLGFGQLLAGVRDGPAQLLSFALPLVSPRSLLVVPVALTWLSGAVAVRCLQRSAATLLPYALWLATFGLAYAATARATLGYPHGAAAADTALGAGLLATLALLRMAQVHAAERLTGTRLVAAGLAIVVVAAGAGAIGLRAGPFTGHPAAAQRVPPITQTRPVAPLGFIAGMRPASGERPVPVFDVLIDHAEPGYFALATVDIYDGGDWSFDRTFRPSGGVIPADLDPALRPTGPTVNQRYVIADGPLAGAPWLPYLDRPARVTGTAISVDPDSGMIVPEASLHAGQSYLATSVTPAHTFLQLPAATPIATSPPPVDTQLPPGTASTLAKLAQTLAAETGVSPSTPIPFLQAVARDLRTNYALSAPAPTTAPTMAPSTAPSRSPTAQRSGGTSFADVLASVLGPQRSATPEQYATLFALLARSLGVPARVVGGFHLRPASGAGDLPSARYQVTTADAWTWVEVAMRGGWAVADPTPTRPGASHKPQSVGAAPTNSPTALPSKQAQVAGPSAQHAAAPPSAVKHRHAGGWPASAIAGVVVGGLIVLLLLGILGAKVLRRARRRRSPDPRIRLVGAWHESLDVLAESGLPGLGALTSGEVVARTADRYGPASAAHAASLGTAANVALFSTAVPVADADADAAWQAQRALRREVRRALPMRLRLLATVRYHRGPHRRH